MKTLQSRADSDKAQVLSASPKDILNSAVFSCYRKAASDCTCTVPGSVNEYQLRLGRQRQVWFIPIADERGVCR